MGSQPVISSGPYGTIIIYDFTPDPSSTAGKRPKSMVLVNFMDTAKVSRIESINAHDHAKGKGHFIVWNEWDIVPKQTLIQYF